MMVNAPATGIAGGFDNELGIAELYAFTAICNQLIAVPPWPSHSLSIARYSLICIMTSAFFLLTHTDFYLAEPPRVS